MPAGVTSVNVEAVGSHGERSLALGGVGAIVSGGLSVKPEQALYVEVGGVTFNGGGNSGSAGRGGGASDVRTVSIGAELSPGNEASLNSRLLVAAGGGGAGSPSPGGGCPGGAGGAAEEKGANGTNCGFPPGEGGGAGEGSKGGAGGLGYLSGNPNIFFVGVAGRLGAGGSGFGGGGGSGLYGGGGGGSQGDQTSGNGGGGGGSNLVPAGGEAKLPGAGVELFPSVTFTYTALPTSIGQCKKNGWKNFGTKFKNQGQCVQFVENTPS